jgi:hypothetical protein
MQNNKLEIGDVVYVFGNYGLVKYVIDRITPTQALAKATKFKIEGSGNGIFHIIGAGKWSTSWANISTPELDLKYKMAGISAFIKSEINLIKNCDATELQAIYNIIKKYKQ